MSDQTILAVSGKLSSCRLKRKKKRKDKIKIDLDLFFVGTFSQIGAYLRVSCVNNYNFLCYCSNSNWYPATGLSNGGQCTV